MIAILVITSALIGLVSGAEVIIIGAGMSVWVPLGSWSTREITRSPFWKREDGSGDVRGRIKMLFLVLSVSFNEALTPLAMSFIHNFNLDEITLYSKRHTNMSFVQLNSPHQSLCTSAVALHFYYILKSADLSVNRCGS